MILSSLSNSSRYSNVHPLFEVAFHFLKANNLNLLEVGKHVIQGEDVFAMVSEYETRGSEESDLEAHRKYIDIQVLGSGSEKIGFANLAGQKITEEYSEEKDVGFFDGDCDYLTIEPGLFGVFFPEDLHKPCIHNLEKTMVKKIVVKVLAKK